ncbi:uncharacterized protein LOC121875408 [Homarus americanus]|uniref:uncharacterized protein LOC121875408 n=1 Tax=Homarus americanus TaxID=6706 RepID=UPI001C45A212|nr:uncharacterized protein LOC121875408 [Homarus americanus]
MDCDAEASHTTSTIAEGALVPEDVYNSIMKYNRVVFTNVPFNASMPLIKLHVEKSGRIFRLEREADQVWVTYLERKGAEKAFKSRQIFLGQRLSVFRPKRSTCSLYLGGLDDNTTQDDILKVISEFGMVVKFNRPNRPGSYYCSPANFCFVEVDDGVARVILQKKRIEINNTIVKVELSCREQSNKPASGPAIEDSGSYKVLLGHLPKEALHCHVRTYFSQFGGLKKTYIKGRNGFLIFDSKESVQNVLSSTHTLFGQQVTPYLENAREKERLFFHGLNPEITDEMISQEISHWGTVLELVRPKDKHTNNLANYCFVTYEEYEVTQELLKRGHFYICHKKIRVKLAEKPRR